MFPHVIRKSRGITRAQTVARYQAVRAEYHAERTPERKERLRQEMLRLQDQTMRWAWVPPTSEAQERAA
ncbi:MAG TPA: hypothetical protein VGW38_07005 [Chloroflexota bacterium]|nr:hypothetical protein [Chloroflexota bacterium]